MPKPNQPRPEASQEVAKPVIASPRQHRNPLPVLALLALNGIAAAAVWQALERPIETTPIKGARVNISGDRPSSVDSGTLLQGSRTLAELPETARRPLFSVTRRPWVEKPKPKPEDAVARVAVPPPRAPVYPANQLQLIGVMQANRSAVARVLIRAGGDAQGTWVQVGESIQGWKVRDVSSDSATIESRGERAELVMDTALPPPPPQPQQPRR